MGEHLGDMKEVVGELLANVWEVVDGVITILSSHWKTKVDRRSNQRDNFDSLYN